MRKNFQLFVLLVTIANSQLNAQSVKGLYVDGFINILGNTQSEDSLLNYAQSNGFNYLALYDLHLVDAQYNMTNVSTITPLANFIQRAKTQFNILKVGAVAENFWFFQNRVRVYNNAHSNPDQKFDVYNLEFEFWNTSTTGPSGYYCTTYLQPAGLTCDTAGGFSFYKNELRKIDSVATLDNLLSETYVGWPNAGQAHQIAGLCDRILLHSYVATDATDYSYTSTRLSYFAGAPSAPVDIIVIFSSESIFMGPWLTSNPETQAFSTYLAAFQNEPSTWVSGINLLGYQWFDYSNMNYTLPLGTSESIGVKNIRLFQHNDQIEIILPDGGMLTEIAIYNSNGQLIQKLPNEIISSNKFSINTCGFTDGIYFINCNYKNSNSIATKFLIQR